MAATRFFAQNSSMRPLAPKTRDKNRFSRRLGIKIP